MSMHAGPLYRVKSVIAGLGRLLWILSNAQNCEKDDRNNEITARDVISISFRSLVQSISKKPITFMFSLSLPYINIQQEITDILCYIN